MTDVATNLHKSRNHDGDNVEATEGKKGADSTDTKATEAFRLALARYASGEEADVVKFYDEVEAVISLALDEGEGQDEVRYSRMVSVLSCVEGGIRGVFVLPFFLPICELETPRMGEIVYR